MRRFLLASFVVLAGCGARNDLADALGGGAGGAGGPPGTPCTPFEETACYDGPRGTEGVGTCRAGVAACLADGSGFGACGGQVLPAGDLCETPVDEDCNGVIAPCLTPWTSFFGPDAGPIGMAVDSEGRVTVAAFYFGTVQVGDTVLSAPPLTAEFFVARLSPTGQVEWA